MLFLKSELTVVFIWEQEETMKMSHLFTQIFFQVVKGKETIKVI